MLEVGHLGHSWRRWHQLWSKANLGSNPAQPLGLLGMCPNLPSLGLLCWNFTLSQEVLSTSNNLCREPAGRGQMCSRCVCGGNLPNSSVQLKWGRPAATLIYLGGSGKQLEELFQLQSWPGWEALVAMQRRGRQRRGQVIQTWLPDEITRGWWRQR